jgi:hypothetical protein
VRGPCHDGGEHEGKTKAVHESLLAPTQAQGAYQ